MASTLSAKLEKVSKFSNVSVQILAILFGTAGYFVSFYFHFGMGFFIILTVINFYYRHVHNEHSLLRHFGFIAQARYIGRERGA